MKKVTIIILSCLLCLTSQSKPKPIFSESDHCVAWKARKVIALVKTVEPIGKNCKITTELKGSRDSFRFLADFPVKNFDSNEPDRDKEVTKILKANDHPSIRFESEGLSADQWNKILEKKSATITGTLKVAGRSRLIDFPITIKTYTPNNKPSYSISGKLITKYSNFRISPPSVGGGLIAKAKDYLELHVHFQSEKIKNFEKVKN